jgi:hypothetical protein
MWCPANAHLETGDLDVPVDYFCQVARARAGLLKRLTFHEKSGIFGAVSKEVPQEEK